MIQDKELLAFIHIEKAAGETFTHILENNYIYGHCRVAPLKKEHRGVFTADAMKTVFLRCSDAPVHLRQLAKLQFWSIKRPFSF